MSDALRNPIWHSLHGPHSGLALSDGRAIRYLPDVSPLCAISESSEAAISDLERIVEVGETIGIWVDPELSLGARWQVENLLLLQQMVCEKAVVAPADSFEELTRDDAEEMLALAERTEPGPFSLRSGDLGRFVGVRQGDRLLAIAGERFRFEGHTELSGVCTDPAARGKGHAARLCRVITAGIQERGERAFLHVIRASPTAGTSIPLYERLGYRDTFVATLSVLRRI